MITTTRVLAAGTGEILGQAARDRFMIDATATDGRFALVQHLFDARALAAPLHRHHAEDEYTYVLSGRIGAVLGTEEVVAEAGDLIFKPRGEWHTFWNAGDEPAAALEIISPGGLERLFRELGLMDEFPDPDRLAAMAAGYRCDIDFEATMPIVERHRLVM
jgi:mannose-6-phosphate isomerase-like protein (cupin superfamily)